MTRRSDVVVRTCPNCGAQLQAESTGGRVACHYCGQSFEAPAPPPPQPRVIVIERPVAERRASVRRGPAAASVVGLACMLLIVVVAGLVSSRKGAPGAALHVPGLPEVTLPGMGSSDFMWDTVGGPPLPAAVGSGGAEGFVGRIQERGSQMLAVAAFEGSKLTPVWRAGPFGTSTQGSTSTLTGVVGHDVVVTDYRATVHVYDLASGRELRSMKLTDRAKSMCVAPDGKPHVWIEVSDEKNVLVDADLGSITAAPRPSWCSERAGAGDDCRGWLRRGPPRPSCKGPEAAAKVNGFEALNVVEDGDLAVALGQKHPGTAVPMAVGFDPKTRAVRWQQPLGSGDPANVAESSTLSVMDAIEGGRFVAPYALTAKGWHFTAFDARSGQRLWDEPLQPTVGADHPEGFSLTATRLYVMRTSSVEVYDAKTGALVGVVGG